MNDIMKALKSQYEADIAKANANIQVYIMNPAGIGEHPDICSAVDSQVQLVAEAEDKLHVINDYYVTPTSLT
jgi:hypothetical protein